MNLDYIEKGQGETVLLLHSTAAGNKQWRKLIELLSSSYRVLAPNLYGYGTTSSWSQSHPQTLTDHVALLEKILVDEPKINIIGHSFGGSVAMMAAKIHKPKVNKLILIEPNPFYLLSNDEESEGYKEAVALCDVIKRNGNKGTWNLAAEYFADYWNGSGSWEGMDSERQDKFISAIKPNYHEWDCVMNETISIEEWKHGLPTNTTVLMSEYTVQSIKGINSLFQSKIPDWSYVNYSDGGHMAPLTHANIINPLIEKVLKSK
tara:strand:- start:186 stop:971 length:786 start_codon:yes stop_codon:yes gene_type:complete